MRQAIAGALAVIIALAIYMWIAKMWASNLDRLDVIEIGSSLVIGWFWTVSALLGKTQFWSSAYRPRH